MLTYTRSDAITGRIVVSDDDEWNAARQAFNVALDQRPEAVAFPLDERDVASLVRLARDRGLQIAAQATGHNAGPLGSLDNTLLVNTSELVGVEIDPVLRRVRVGAATKWEAVTERLSVAGLAALHGSSPDVGIVGYSLGGGLGWLARKYGLQANSVTAIELVTADGRLLRVDPDHEPELFWALRGGGGNFGVVTAIEFEVYPVERLYAGAMLFPFEQASDVLDTWTELLPSMPDEMMSWALLGHFPDLPFVPEPLRERSFAGVLAAFLGDEAEGRELLWPVQKLGPIMDTYAMAPPFALAELAMDPPEPLPYQITHQLIDELSGESIDRLVGASDRDSQLALVQLRHMGGALAGPAPDAGARATLPGEIGTLALGIVPDADTMAVVGESLGAIDEILAPHEVGLYPSFVEETTDASQFFDPATWARLREVKSKYDPDDLFRANHHVPPAE